MGLSETITHCKIQNVLKMKYFEISGPVEYSTGMVLAEYSADCPKIAYFHAIFYSSSNTYILTRNGSFRKPYYHN